MSRPIAKTTRRPCWYFDRHDRLASLASLAYRARELAEPLRRERCDFFSDREIRSRLAARIEILEVRRRALAACARRDRHQAVKTRICP